MYPIAGWFRVACRYITRAVDSKWNDQAGEVAIKMVNEVILKVKDEDPIKVHWYVPKTIRVLYGVMLVVLLLKHCSR